jgi:hypothetical protein
MNTPFSPCPTVWTVVTLLALRCRALHRRVCVNYLTVLERSQFLLNIGYWYCFSFGKGNIKYWPKMSYRCITSFWVYWLENLIWQLGQHLDIPISSHIVGHWGRLPELGCTKWTSMDGFRKHNGTTRALYYNSNTCRWIISQAWVISILCFVTRFLIFLSLFS